MAYGEPQKIPDVVCQVNKDRKRLKSKRVTDPDEIMDIQIKKVEQKLTREDMLTKEVQEIMDV